MKASVTRLVIVVLVCVTSCTRASSVTLTKSGIALDAGTIGKFNLTYPSLTAGGGPISADVSGNTADIGYANGTTIHLTLSSSGDVTCDLANLPADTKNFRMDLTVPESVKGTARWSIDGSEPAEFPVQKVNGAFMFRANARKFNVSSLKEAKDGFTINIASGWMQLQDNRFWNGHEFQWFTAMDIPASDGKATISFNIADGAGEPITVKAAPINLLSVKLSDNGVVVSNGKAGELRIELPSLVSGGRVQSSSGAKLSEDGQSIDLKYPDGAVCHLVLMGKALTFDFSGLTKDITSFRIDSLIPIGFAGGSYTIGGELKKNFPQQKPADPFLYQGNASQIEIVHPSGPDFEIRLPDYSQQQLQDDREWGTESYSWWMTTPVDPERGTAVFHIKFSGGNASSM